MKRAIAGVILAACGATPAPSVAPPTPVAQATEPITPEPIEAEKPAAAPSEKLAAPPIDPQCYGDHLELAVSRCVVDMRAAPLPASITLAIDPSPITVKSGDHARPALVLTNTSSAEVALLLEDGCDQLFSPSTRLDDSHGKRADVLGSECDVNGACGTASIAVTLKPGGTATVPFDVNGWSESVNDDCSRKRVRNLARGTYGLTVESVLGTFKSPVIVK